MTSALLARSVRVFAFAISFSAAAVSSLWADPVTVTSGQLQFGRGGPDALFTFSGTDGFFLQANVVPITLVSPLCPSGCRPGNIVNLSLLAGAASGHPPQNIPLPPAFTLGTGQAAIVNGTVFGTPGALTFPGALASQDPFASMCPRSYWRHRSCSRARILSAHRLSSTEM